MNSTHAVAGGVGLSFGAALAGAISGTWHLDPQVAGDWVVVGTGVASSLGGLIAWFVRWRYPNIPPPPIVANGSSSPPPLVSSAA